jgi:hypothetical protein
MLHITHRTAQEQLLRQLVPRAGRTPQARQCPHAPTRTPLLLAGFGASRLPSIVLEFFALIRASCTEIIFIVLRAPTTLPIMHIKSVLGSCMLNDWYSICTWHPQFLWTEPTINYSSANICRAQCRRHEMSSAKCSCNVPSAITQLLQEIICAATMIQVHPTNTRYMGISTALRLFIACTKSTSATGDPNVIFLCGKTTESGG